jgi:pimeloyl-ACP methyl ester carboxylesterase
MIASHWRAAGDCKAMAAIDALEFVTGAGEGLRQRVALAREAAPDEAGGPSLRRLLGELAVVGEPFRRALRAKAAVPAAAIPRNVILLPGFATHPVRLRFLARGLSEAGHRVADWGQGFNWGASAARLDRLEQRVNEIAARHCEPVVLVGWSLGGLFAREIAKRRPHEVAKVVTMGSPFSYNPRANNVWRAYQFVTGHRVDNPPVAVELSVKPPVETVALWSPRDGIVHPRSARGVAGERDREVALRCTHMGFAYDPEAIAAVLRELDRE